MQRTALVKIVSRLQISPTLRAIQYRGYKPLLPLGLFSFRRSVGSVGYIATKKCRDSEIPPTEKRNAPIPQFNRVLLLDDVLSESIQYSSQTSVSP